MYSYRKLTEDLFWVGGSDRKQALFEGAFPIPEGMAYHSYLLTDEKTVLLDTVDEAVRRVFEESVEAVLAGRPLDYIVINHMEPDHGAGLEELLRRYPNAKIVGNAKTAAMLNQFFCGYPDRVLTVSDGDTLVTGRHTLRFVMAPMVHWPETMVTYDETDQTLFCADAFGSFGAVSGNLYADETDFKRDFLPEARRYYANIVGKYGVPVQGLLKKAAGLEIRLLCPLHGLIWRRDIDWLVEKYQRWSTYSPEDKSVVIAYASVYGNTANAAELLAARLADRGVRGIKMYDVSVTHPSYVLSECFRASHLVFAAPTYNAGIFCTMQTLLHDIAAHTLANRTVALIENGSWAPSCAKQMKELLAPLKNVTVLEEVLTVRSSLKPDQLARLDALADALAASVNA